jgi:hypothetical protein
MKIYRYENFQIVMNEGFFDAMGRGAGSLVRKAEDIITGKKSYKKMPDQDDLAKEILDHLNSLPSDYNRTGEYRDGVVYKQYNDRYTFIMNFKRDPGQKYKIDVSRHTDFRTKRIPEYTIVINKLKGSSFQKREIPTDREKTREQPREQPREQGETQKKYPEEKPSIEREKETDKEKSPGPKQQEEKPSIEGEKGTGKEKPSIEGEKGTGKEKPSIEGEKGTGKEKSKQQEEKGTGKEKPSIEGEKGTGKEKSKQQEERGTGKEKSRDDSPGPEPTIKQMYRRAALICHPDKFPDKFYQHHGRLPDESELKKSEELFRELDNAYKSNNVSRVKEILKNLKEKFRKSEVMDHYRLSRHILNYELFNEEINLGSIKNRSSRQTISSVDHSKDEVLKCDQTISKKIFNKAEQLFRLTNKTVSGDARGGSNRP